MLQSFWFAGFRAAPGIRGGHHVLQLLMNPNLTPEECHACLEILHRGLVHIRMAGWGGNAQQAAVIADALHNLPHLLSVGHKFGWDLATFKADFLATVGEQYPDLVSLSRPLEQLR